MTSISEQTRTFPDIRLKGVVRKKCEGNVFRRNNAEVKW
jgi:hypothetical protein